MNNQILAENRIKITLLKIFQIFYQYYQIIYIVFEVYKILNKKYLRALGKNIISKKILAH